MTCLGGRARGGGLDHASTWPHTSLPQAHHQAHRAQRTGRIAACRMVGSTADGLLTSGLTLPKYWLATAHPLECPWPFLFDLPADGEAEHH